MKKKKVKIKTGGTRMYNSKTSKIKSRQAKRRRRKKR